MNEQAIAFIADLLVWSTLIVSSVLFLIGVYAVVQGFRYGEIQRTAQRRRDRESYVLQLVRDTDHMVP